MSRAKQLCEKLSGKDESQNTLDEGMRETIKTMNSKQMAEASRVMQERIDEILDPKGQPPFPAGPKSVEKMQTAKEKLDYADKMLRKVRERYDGKKK